MADELVKVINALSKRTTAEPKPYSESRPEQTPFDITPAEIFLLKLLHYVENKRVSGGNYLGATAALVKYDPDFARMQSFH